MYPDEARAILTRDGQAADYGREAHEGGLTRVSTILGNISIFPCDRKGKENLKQVM